MLKMSLNKSNWVFFLIKRWLKNLKKKGANNFIPLKFEILFDNNMTLKAVKLHVFVVYSVYFYHSYICGSIFRCIA